MGPGQIAGIGKIIGYPVSHEWIYDCVQHDKLLGGKLYKQFRYGRRKYPNGSREKRIIVPNRIGIEHRPAIVDKKNRFGNWEADTVLGKQGTGAIISLVERKSKLYVIPAKSAADVCRTTVSMLWRYRLHVPTITADKGSEFCAHELVAKKLKADIYFANSYSSWERGLNENFNGLIPQYIRKSTNLQTVTAKQVADIECALNARSWVRTASRRVRTVT